MKKTLILFSTALLFAAFTFAQTPQTKETAQPAAKTETTAKPAATKDAKSGCDKKDMEKCSHSKEAKGCCAKDTKKTTTTTPEKK
jgi:hypothetical protein